MLTVISLVESRPGVYYSGGNYPTQYSEKYPTYTPVKYPTLNPEKYPTYSPGGFKTSVYPPSYSINSIQFPVYKKPIYTPFYYPSSPYGKRLYINFRSWTILNGWFIVKLTIFKSNLHWIILMSNKKSCMERIIVQSMFIYKVSHETWQLVNNFECHLPHTVLDIKHFLQFIS